MSERSPPLLAVEALSVRFRTPAGDVDAVDRISFEIARGEMLGLVGESGSGKSVTCHALLGILGAGGEVAGGRALFGGMDLIAASEDELAQIRGRELSMIFQNPRAALNPIRRVGRQMEDVLLRHGPVTPGSARGRAIEALRQVRIPDPAARYAAYPFELSGGQCQRVMIALALACSPALLIADEPTTGLDVTTQAAIMELIAELARQRGMATLLITHDLALAGEYCDRIAVMHAGQLVEIAPVDAIFESPRHPYTARLVGAMPRRAAALGDLAAIRGNLPDLRRTDLPGCRFLERCDRAAADCAGPLAWSEPRTGHRVGCRHPL